MYVPDEGRVSFVLPTFDSIVKANRYVSWMMVLEFRLPTRAARAIFTPEEPRKCSQSKCSQRNK